MVPDDAVRLPIEATRRMDRRRRDLQDICLLPKAAVPPKGYLTVGQFLKEEHPMIGMHGL